MHGVLHIGLGVAGVGVGDARSVEQLGLKVVEEYDEIEDEGIIVECDTEREVERNTGREMEWIEVEGDTGGEIVVDGRETIVEGDTVTAGEMEYVEVAGRVVERDIVAGRVLIDCGSAD